MSTKCKPKAAYISEAGNLLISIGAGIMKLLNRIRHSLFHRRWVFSKYAGIDSRGYYIWVESCAKCQELGVLRDPVIYVVPINR